MPIYEYECQECGHQMDALQKISEPVLVKCPACSKDELKKLVSAPQFRLKGGGWYETDFKKDKRRNIAGDGDKSASSEKTADGGKKTKEDSGSGNPVSGKSDSSAGAATEKKPAAKKSDT
ncbi:MAG: zinc ribbon domain-containing protein [Gammaproteobacteria bacterium]|nr:zinc ribbon domain-containing protein [Gammaproteobacteria bacterium]